jgi:hypothetical protein
MKMMYCWRCRMDVPMLDDEEFAIIDRLFAQAVRAIKESYHLNSPATNREFISDQYRPMLEAYRRLTGQEYSGRPEVLMHHRISKYGLPCTKCGKPLRTPKAKLCAACGEPVSRDSRENAL